MKRLLVHLVVSALLLWLVSLIVPGIRVAGFGAALLGGILLGVFNLFASAALNR